MQLKKIMKSSHTEASEILIYMETAVTLGTGTFLDAHALVMPWPQ